MLVCNAVQAMSDHFSKYSIAVGSNVNNLITKIIENYETRPLQNTDTVSFLIQDGYSIKKTFSHYMSGSIIFIQLSYIFHTWFAKWPADSLFEKARLSILHTAIQFVKKTTKSIMSNLAHLF